ncbi:conserved hypothetical protein [Gloeothece citriformis PCC 7424]|uniref:Uncharacterized protein n=1 Tax=Gloeothece citriformis (strain PCC 7424) TaxID=65393 RepID=B7KGL2_GLOC7|nr:hypothetical protein [Gloeothece citriformis]ACK71939.1 conserved hypothetical protein [Gloeothece citriformis PCC 7424]
MHYSIPKSPEEIIAFRNQPVDEEMIVAAIAGLIKITRSQGRSLEELTAEVLAEDPLLDQVQRRWLSQIVTQAWESLP